MGIKGIGQNQAGAPSANRKYKDSLFRMVFGGKEALLSLYNAVNGTGYGDAGGLRVNTLDNAVFLNMKNDISFVFNFHLSMFEYQSSYCGNMGLRCLFYLCGLLQSETSGKSLYSSKTIRFPAPVFVVFYNGTDSRPERWTEKLSSAFEQHMDDPKLELEVLFLNVNDGQNQALMGQCRLLKEYAAYVAKVRGHAKTMAIADAVAKAVEESINEGILVEFLTKHKAEAIRVSILEYDEERDLELMRRDEREIGEARGVAIGEARGVVIGEARGVAIGEARGVAIGVTIGEAKQIIATVRKKIQKGAPAEEIADHLELDLDTVQRVMGLIAQNPGLDDGELAKQLAE